MACQYKRIEAAITKCTIRRVRRVLCIVGIFWCTRHFRGIRAPFCNGIYQISRLATIVLTFAAKNCAPHKQKAPARFASNRGLHLSECSMTLLNRLRGFGEDRMRLARTRPALRAERPWPACPPGGGGGQG